MAIDVQLAWPARAALQTLPPTVRERLDDALDQIRTGQAAQSANVTAFVLDGLREMFMYRLGDELRIVYEMTADGAVVRDILSREFAGRHG